MAASLTQKWWANASHPPFFSQVQMQECKQDAVNIYPANIVNGAHFFVKKYFSVFLLIVRFWFIFKVECQEDSYYSFTVSNIWYQNIKTLAEHSNCTTLVHVSLAEYVFLIIETTSNTFDTRIFEGLVHSFIKLSIKSSKLEKMYFAKDLKTEGNSPDVRNMKLPSNGKAEQTGK